MLIAMPLLASTPVKAAPQWKHSVKEDTHANDINCLKFRWLYLSEVVPVV